MKSLSIIVPVYNEEEGVKEIIERLLKHKKVLEKKLDFVEIIFVDDGSKDSTYSILKNYEKEVRIIKHEKNKGYGAALKTGFKESKGELISFLDADCTYPPEYLIKLVEKIEKEDADLVIGSRFGKKTRMPKLRFLGNKVFAFFLRILTNSKASDTASGMRVFKRKILPYVFNLPDGLEFTPAMSTKLYNESFKIEEIPIPYSERKGRSKLSVIKHGIRFLYSIFNLAILYNPLTIFGLIGGIFLLLSIFLSIFPIIFYLQNNRVPDFLFYRAVAITLFSYIGLSSILFGYLANKIVSIWTGVNIKNNLITKIIYNNFFMNNYAKIGFIFVIFSILLNNRTILQYITTGHIYVHWSYIILGITFFLLGIQILFSKLILNILEQVRYKRKI
ncbi:MAG: glycosyltransferase [Candidatus Woesearchaeota archaeon]